MARANAAMVSFNGGEIGSETLARTQLDNYASCSARFENVLSEPGGMMHFRPGTKYCADLTNGSNKTRGHHFVYDEVKHGILFSAGEVRIEQGGGVIVRPAVTATINTPAFYDLPYSTWVDASAGSGAISATADDGLVLTSNGTDEAAVKQAVTINEVGTTHGVRIVVTRGPVTLLLGSTDGGEEYIRTSLNAGTHSLGVAPSTSTLHIKIISTSEAEAIVASCDIEAAGDLVLPTEWTEAECFALMFETSNDVLWCYSGTKQQKRIETRGAASWSIADTDERDGPFRTPNIDESYYLTPSTKTGNGTLTASRALFKSTHVGALFRLTHSGQSASRTCSGASQFSDYIKVQGAGAGRTFQYAITGTFSATVTLQRSIGNTTAWTDVTTFTAAASSSYLDGTSFDNQTVYYRLGIKTGDYSSGSAVVALTYTGGTSDGVGRVTAYTSATVVEMEVLDPFGSTDATTDWAEGQWSSYRGFPAAPALFDGRLWSGGPLDRFFGSVSDGYASQLEGDDDADAISRQIAVGSAKKIVSFLPLARLIALTSHDAAQINPVRVDGGPPVIKSTAFDEPLTPSNLTVKSTAASRGVFIDESGILVMELYYSVEAQDYEQRSLMRLNKNLGRDGITQLAYARKPHPRIYAVRSDGQLLVKLYDTGENALGWSRYVTDGEVESVYVKRAAAEDEVMLVVKRTVGGTAKRYLEQLDPLYLTSAAAANRVDAYVRKEDAGGFTVITGLGHLEGEVVKVWADGAAHADRTVASGQITLSRSATKAVAGLGYAGYYESVKLAMVSQGGTALAQMGKPLEISFLIENSTRSFQFGADFTTMDWLPERSSRTAYDAATGLETGTTDQYAVPGDPSRDPRLCLKFQSPYPASILGYVIAHQTQERAA